jgi:hypothetical protein
MNIDRGLRCSHAVRTRKQTRSEPGSDPYFVMAYDLCVPKTSSESCDQAIFIDQGTGVSLFSDAVLAEIDRLG